MPTSSDPKEDTHNHPRIHATNRLTATSTSQYPNRGDFNPDVGRANQHRESSKSILRPPGRKLEDFFAESTPPADRKETRGSSTPQHHTNPASSPLAPHMFSKAFTKHKIIVMIVQIGVSLKEMFWSKNFRALVYSLILRNGRKMPKSYPKNIEERTMKKFLPKALPQTKPKLSKRPQKNH